MISRDKYNYFILMSIKYTMNTLFPKSRDVIQSPIDQSFQTQYRHITKPNMPTIPVQPPKYCIYTFLITSGWDDQNNRKFL